MEISVHNKVQKEEFTAHIASWKTAWNYLMENRQMNNNYRPRVSIGMPVFNGEKYIRFALDSILAQSFQCFELIISDNASTDRTQEICLEYVAKDKRIRYYRNKQNIGAARNHNRVFELSVGEYFKWAAHDDILAPDFLSQCLNVLDRDPSTVLCHSKTGRINERGELLGKYEPKIRYSSSKAHQRFGDSIAFSNDAWVLLFGLIRPNSLKMTRLFQSYIGSDRNLLAEISLTGRFYEIPNLLFFRREHGQAYTNKNYKNHHEQLAWWTKTNLNKLVFPYWRRYIEYFNSVRRMHLKWIEKQMCYAQIIKCLMKEGWILLIFDLATNIVNAFRIRNSNVRKQLHSLVKPFLRRGRIY
jgi:glycosyltransferase involved in cell wall biosynthesis